MHEEKFEYFIDDLEEELKDLPILEQLNRLNEIRNKYRHDQEVVDYIEMLISSSYENKEDQNRIDIEIKQALEKAEKYFNDEKYLLTIKELQPITYLNDFHRHMMDSRYDLRSDLEYVLLLEEDNVKLINRPYAYISYLLGYSFMKLNDFNRAEVYLENALLYNIFFSKADIAYNRLNYLRFKQKYPNKLSEQLLIDTRNKLDSCYARIYELEDLMEYIKTIGELYYDEGKYIISLACFNYYHLFYKRYYKSNELTEEIEKLKDILSLSKDLDLKETIDIFHKYHINYQFHPAMMGAMYIYLKDEEGNEKDKKHIEKTLDILLDFTKDIYVRLAKCKYDINNSSSHIFLSTNTNLEVGDSVFVECKNRELEAVVIEIKVWELLKLRKHANDYRRVIAIISKGDIDKTNLC